jgi:hypothetical protein
MGVFSLLMTVWEVCLCGFRKEKTGAYIVVVIYK